MFQQLDMRNKMNLLGLTTPNGDRLWWKILSPNGKEELEVTIGFDPTKFFFPSVVTKKVASRN